MKLYSLLYALIALLLVACKGGRVNEDTRLALWEEQMMTAPDSVLQILENTDVASLTSQHDRARYHLLLMMARDKCYLPLRPDSMLNEATEYFHRQNDLLNETKARYYAGLAERHVGNYQKAIWETMNAIDRAHEAADTFWMGRTHDLAYEIYTATYDCRNAAIEADKAAVYFKRAGATPFHRYALLEKAQALNYPVYDDGTPVGEGMHILDSLKKVALNDRDSALVANCLYQQCIYSFEIINYPLAERQIDSLSIFTKDSTLLNYLLPNIISMQITKGLHPISLLQKYEDRLHNFKDTISYLYRKSQLAAYNKDWYTAYTIYDSLYSYYNTVMGNKTFKSIDEIKDRYNKAIIETKEKENVRLRRTKTIIGGITLTAIIISILVIVLIRIRNKHRETETMARLLDIASENETLKIQLDIQKELVDENKILKEKIHCLEKDISLYENLEIRIKEYDNILSENLSLKEKLYIKSIETSHIGSKNIMGELDTMFNLSLKRSSLLGNRIDVLCKLAMEYYDQENNQTYKNELYNRVLKELKQLKSEKFQKDFEKKVNEVHNNILTRMIEQLPEINKNNLRWIAMIIGGLHPRTISFLLDMKIQTLYTRRLRFRSYIEKSDSPDKAEFLIFFPKSKEKE